MRAINSLIRIITRQNQNVKISFVFKSLYGFSQGIFLVIYNLYLIELDIPLDMIGMVLSANPLALAVGSIPVGYLTEIIGFKKSFLLIYGISGISLLAQIFISRVELMMIAAFICGLALSGDFVANMTFLAHNTTEDDRTKIYSYSSLFFNLFISIGSLIAVILPNILINLELSILIVYRLTLLISGGLLVAASLLGMKISQNLYNQEQQVDFKPYFQGIDTFTVKQIITLLCLGISLGLLTPFMNLYFIYHLGSDREFFGTISSLNVFFISFAIIVGPLIVIKWRSVPVVTTVRLIFVSFLVIFTWTDHLMIGAIAYWIMMSLFQMSQPISLGFAIRASTKRHMTAVISWINVAFWLGYAIAAPVVGFFMFQSRYRYPLFIAIITMLLASSFNQVFFDKIEKTFKTKKDISTVL
ncbi:MAG: MFS transporter [Chloroflexi bacterium]|nr:MFS transporter [Chloroflexota bacterium]